MRAGARHAGCLPAMRDIRSLFQSLHRPPPRPPRGGVTADFPGAASPVGSRVRFTVRDRSIVGTVAELQRARAVVLAGGGERWKVPYGLLTVVERVPERECTLIETAV